MIVLCADDTGRWGKKGIFATIGSRFPVVQEEFEQAKPASGKCLWIRQTLNDDDEGDKLYAAIVIGQKATSFLEVSGYLHKVNK